MLLLLLGCATGPKYSEVAASLPKIASEKGRIYFYRVSVIGGAYQPDISVNQNRVGSAKPKGVFYQDLAPGNYIVTTSMAQGKEVSLNLAAGEEKYVRLAYRFGFNVFPELVDNDTGRQEIQDLSFTQP